MDNTQAIKEYNLQVVGISFKTAPVELREKLAVAPDHIPGILSQLHHISGVQEILLLSTCNRVEIYGVPEEDKGWEEDIFKFLLDKSGLLPSQLRPHIYIKNGWQTLQHLFRVAASLDSMVVGEPQILGQLKEAYKLANKSNSCGKNLTWILPRAFKVAKRIRHETGIGSGLVSVSHIAIELSKRIFSDLQSRQVILVGAGKMGVLAARALLEHISEPMIIINRSLEKAQELATDTNGIAAGMDQLDNRLLDADIAIISTGAADYVLTEKEVFTLLRRRRYRPLFLIDLSVPRNIDPAVNKLDNVYLYDIDALESIARENINSRQSEVVKAEQIVKDEVKKVQISLRGLALAPTISELRNMMQGICQNELEKTIRNIDQLDVEERNKMDMMINSIVNKILHYPITNLKQADSNDSQKRLLESIHYLFNL